MKRFGITIKFSVKEVFFIAALFLFLNSAYSQKNETTRSPYDYSFKELSQINVTTGSFKNESFINAPVNVTIITSKMIEERNYQTLIDICQDIPGFDFMTYNDGGGEYPTYNMNRGVGSIGNSKILVMIDGVVQNNISFNWSLLWTYENIFIDVERIEIIQGPGSVLYGAQAFSGIIHIISKKNIKGVNAKVFYGKNQTFGADVFAGKNFKNDFKLSFSLHTYNTTGDLGNRFDPGNYFHGNKKPDTILQNYDLNNIYLENTHNTEGGNEIPDGFNTKNNSFSFRIKGKYKNTEINAFFWEYEKGGGSHIVAYKYNITDKSYKSKSRGYHILVKNDRELNSKLNLNSNIVLRATHVLPGTGFKYLYKFPDLIKNYASYSYQSYLEEKLFYKFSRKNVILFGIKGSYSKKSERIVSLGKFPSSKNISPSSWNIAQSGTGLNIEEKYNPINVYETATYLLWDNTWADFFSSSIGLRYDFSTEFGNILNPRLALIYQAKNGLTIKYLYGTAFRQPSIFELTNEFRGNPDLKPEKIRTYELEISSLFFENKFVLKTNIFYSDMYNFINKKEDPSMPSGERFENIGNSKVSGGSMSGTYKFTENICLTANYNYLIGKFLKDNNWNAIERTAQHKINAGINVNVLNKKLMFDLRMNYVGKRKAQKTNKWLQTYENGFAPSYTKFNINVSYKLLKSFTVQLSIYNLFDEQYYGIGRETGSGYIDDYDYRTNPNPTGHIPSYHPQAGRTFNINLVIKIK